MEVASIPAFIRNVAMSITAHPSMSFDDLNSHLHSLGWNDCELDTNTFYLIMAIFEPDLSLELTYCFDSALTHHIPPKLGDQKGQMPAPPIGGNMPLKE